MFLPRLHMQILRQQQMNSFIGHLDVGIGGRGLAPGGAESSKRFEEKRRMERSEYESCDGHHPGKLCQSV